MKTRHHKIVIISIAVGLFFINPITNVTAKTEKILDFHSDIVIHTDGSMTVTETIEVICAGIQIKRGIFRFFPTRYRDRFGNRISVSFEVLETLKNGEPEPYHTKSEGDGINVYFGQSDVFLRHGEYTYTLVYRTDRQLGFFDEFDELYWNVTGNAWDFVIDRAEAVITLPEGADAINMAGYTGPKGAQGKEFSVQTDTYGRIRFNTTRALQPEEGLTIAVSFTKGIIPEPTLQDKVGYVVQDNLSALAALIGLAIILLYYVIVWIRVGKDPAKGTIIPRFHPPEGYSPAAVRFVMRMGYNDRVFAAAIVSMAVKKYLTIHEHKGKFILSKIMKNDTSLTPGERKIAKKLFRSNLEIELKQKNHKRISGAVNVLKKSLKADFEKMNFRRNGGYGVPGYLLTLFTLVAVVVTAPVREGAIFMSIWLSIWTAGCMALVLMVLRGWKAMFAGGRFNASQSGATVFLTLFSLPFIGAELFALWTFSTMTSPVSSVLLLFLVFINVLFMQLLKAPTVYGRKMMDEIEGFKMYLEVAEEERLDMLHPPDKTPELFEKYLPYALALDVENAWSEKFSDVLAKAGQDDGYSPHWYTGTSWRTMGATGFVSRLGSSFSSAISSSSSAPGSSSGSGGGGFSGGGGGGGGGGGW